MIPPKVRVSLTLVLTNLEGNEVHKPPLHLSPASDRRTSIAINHDMWTPPAKISVSWHVFEENVGPLLGSKHLKLQFDRFRTLLTSRQGEARRFANFAFGQIYPLDTG